MMIYIRREMKKIVHWLGQLLLYASIYLLCLSAHAEDVFLLQIKPARCIALHEGQMCYQVVKVNWQADAADTYCLYKQDNKTPVTCWENQSAGKTVYEFEGDVTTRFFLLRKRDAKPVAEFTFEVAWVYDAKSHRESHWRIF